MRYQEIITRKQRVIRLLWILPTLLLGLALSGWVSPIKAQVTLCEEHISPDPDGVYRLRGHLTCSTDPILYIDEAGAEFDLRGFIATGDTSNTGIRIDADNVILVGGKVKKCETALRIEADGCEIEHFKAIDSSDKAIRIRGDGNTIVKSHCIKAGNDCFELRGDGPDGNTAEWCTAIKSGTPEQGQGIQFRGPGYAYRCSAIGGSNEGFQIQGGVSNVTIERCLAINNAKGGIEIKETATGNFIEHNIAFSNGDGISYFDLFDGNANCEDNTWKGNKFRSSNPYCIK